MKRLICKCGRLHRVTPDAIIIKRIVCNCGNEEEY